jgi:hypothetical protein
MGERAGGMKEVGYNLFSVDRAALPILSSQARQFSGLSAKSMEPSRRMYTRKRFQASKSEPRVSPTSEPEWDTRNITSFAEKCVQDDGIDQGYVVRGGQREDI